MTDNSREGFFVEKLEHDLDVKLKVPEGESNDDSGKSNMKWILSCNFTTGRYIQVVGFTEPVRII